MDSLLENEIMVLIRRRVDVSFWFVGRKNLFSLLAPNYLHPTFDDHFLSYFLSFFQAKMNVFVYTKKSGEGEINSYPFYYPPVLNSSSILSNQWFHQLTW